MTEDHRLASVDPFFSLATSTTDLILGSVVSGFNFILSLIALRLPQSYSWHFSQNSRFGSNLLTPSLSVIQRASLHSWKSDVPDDTPALRLGAQLSLCYSLLNTYPSQRCSSPATSTRLSSLLLWLPLVFFPLTHIPASETLPWWSSRMDL